MEDLDQLANVLIIEERVQVLWRLRVGAPVACVIVTLDTVKFLGKSLA